MSFKELAKDLMIIDFILWCRQKHFTLKGISEEDIAEIVHMYLKEKEG